MIAQFNDASETIVTAIFYSPQPLDVVPYQGEIEASAPRYKTWWDTLDPLTQMTCGLPQPTAA